MADYSWIETVEELAPAALTVRAQVLSPNDDGRLVWDVFFPRADVDSVDLDNVFTLDYRPVADRREWNARGRHVPLLTPERRKVSMVPIESYNKVDEREMQKLVEGTFGNADTIMRVIGARIPDRSDMLAMSTYRRLEIDAMSAWGNGTITQRNPEDASKTYAASFAFDAARMSTAGTAWNVVADAYNEFLAWLRDAIEAVGPIEGVMLRQATYQAILDDAPDLPNGVKMTYFGLNERVRQDIGTDFMFLINENSLDVFTDGGTARTRTKIWPAQKVAVIPQGRMVGNAAFAPVVRAYELSQVAPEAGIDVRGVTVYHEVMNGGRELDLQAQLNAIPVPDESKIFTIDAGV